MAETKKKRPSLEKPKRIAVSRLVSGRQYDRLEWDAAASPGAVGTFLEQIASALTEEGEFYVPGDLNRAFGGAVRVVFGNPVREEDGYFVYKRRS